MQESTDGPEWRVILRQEFEASEGSFVLRLRCEGWDKEAHLRLFKAMIECCKAHEGRDHIERWIAEGFWWLEFYSRQYTEGNEEAPQYLINAVTNFNHLSHWLFTGVGRAKHEFEVM